MRFGKKIFTVLLFSILTFSAASINAQEINKNANVSAPSSPFNFGIEAAFIGQYFTVKGDDVKNNGLRPGFGINVLAEYTFTADRTFLGTIEPGISFTSGRFYRNSTAGTHFHTKKSLTNLNIPITAKYVVYDSVPVGFFVQGGIVPGINLSQKSEDVTAGSVDKAHPFVPVHEKSFYLGAMVALGINLNVLPTGSLQARIGWEPTFTNIGNGNSNKSSLKATVANTNATLNTDIKQNFLFFGVAYKF